jgi:hypothetical protein
MFGRSIFSSEQACSNYAILSPRLLQLQLHAVALRGGGMVHRILLSAFGRCPDRDVVQCSTADARTSIRPQLAFDDQGPFQGEDRKGHGFLDGSTNNRRSGACWRAAVVD